mgnify:CR=1 FL=1
MVTRGNDLRLSTSCTKYDLRKQYFTNRVTSTWNSLPNYVVTADNVNMFKNRLDKFWRNKKKIFLIIGQKLQESEAS